MLREGGRGAAAARAGPKAQVNAVRTTVIVYNTRKHGAEAEVAKCIERPAPRSKWMASRGLRAVWEGETLVRKVFRALQLWVAMAGPDGLRRHREERAARAPGAAAQEEHRDGAEAFDAWAKWGACLRLGRGLRATGSAASGALEEAEVRARKRLVWLRHASFNPEATRAKAAAAEQAAAAKAAAFAAALAAKRAAEAARRAAKVAARRAAAHVRMATALARAAIAQGLAEDAAVRSGAGSLAAGRGQRRAAQETNAAIDGARAVSQRTEGERDEASTTLPHKCGRGHLLQRVPVAASEVGSVRCDGPCGRAFRHGDARLRCEAGSCDVDICITCVAESSTSRRARVCCATGHGMVFRQVGAQQRRTWCDGGCNAHNCDSHSRGGVGFQLCKLRHRCVRRLHGRWLMRARGGPRGQRQKDGERGGGARGRRGEKATVAGGGAGRGGACGGGGG